MANLAFPTRRYVQAKLSMHLETVARRSSALPTLANVSRCADAVLSHEGRRLTPAIYSALHGCDHFTTSSAEHLQYPPLFHDIISVKVVIEVWTSLIFNHTCRAQNIYGRTA